MSPRHHRASNSAYPCLGCHPLCWDRGFPDSRLDRVAGVAFEERVSIGDVLPGSRMPLISTQRTQTNRPAAVGVGVEPGERREGHQDVRVVGVNGYPGSTQAAGGIRYHLRYVVVVG